jgi:hypothetical protein
VHEPEPNDATPFLPEQHTLPALREAAAHCHGCHLWRGVTETARDLAVVAQVLEGRRA